MDLDCEVSEEMRVWNDDKKRYETVTKMARGYARYRAVVTDGKGRRATATKSEKDELTAIMQECKALGLATDTASWQAWKLSVVHDHVSNKALKTAEIALLREALEEYKLRGIPGAA